MKFTPGRSGDSGGGQIRTLTSGSLVWGGGRERTAKKPFSIVLWCCQEEKKTCKGWRVGQGVDATSNSDLRELR